MRLPAFRLPLLSLSLLLTVPTQADEGMWPLWPLQRVPLAAIQQQLGVQLDAAWLARQQGAAVNVGGASGSFVSGDGLVLTNHHVVRGCIDRLSTAQDDLAAKGFVAARREQERRCPGLSLRVLQEISDVSERIPTEAQARKAAISALEAGCSAPQRCQVVALWGGARHHLYRFAEYRDARLVMAPEDAAASFGGDDDNFHYPRYAFDFALLRAYDDEGRAVRPAHWLRPATQALQREEAVFTIGHPGRTERLRPAVVLEAQRDVELPVDIAQYADEQAVLKRHAARDLESARQAQAPLAGVENRLKALRGELPGLQDAAAMARRRAMEARLGLPAASWQLAERAAQAQRRHYRELAAMRPMRGSLIAMAMDLAALRHEDRLPEAERLDDYRGTPRQRLDAGLRANTPFYAALEQARLAAFIERAQAQLGEQHAFVRALRPQGLAAGAAAAHWIASTRLGSAAERATRLHPERAAEDTLLQLAETLQALRRPLQQVYEQDFKHSLAALAGPLAQARWQLLGDSEAPDATGTLRLSYGRTEEVVAGGLRQPWKSTLQGLFARADAFDGQAPHDLSERLQQRREALQRFAATPLNFISSNDIIGGNSGSPLVNARGELVGLAFDGNIDSLPGRFHYDGRVNRTVSVHLDAIFLALEQIYDAAHLAREMKGKS